MINLWSCNLEFMRQVNKKSAFHMREMTAWREDMWVRGACKQFLIARAHSVWVRESVCVRGGVGCERESWWV